MEKVTGTHQSQLNGLSHYLAGRCVWGGRLSFCIQLPSQVHWMLLSAFGISSTGCTGRKRKQRKRLCDMWEFISLIQHFRSRADCSIKSINRQGFALGRKIPLQRAITIPIVKR